MNAFCELDEKSFFPWIQSLWGIRVKRICPELEIQGSPERSLSRVVLEDDLGGFFLLEKFAREKYPARQRVAQTLAHLNQHGLTRALAPCKTKSHTFLDFFGENCFQLTRFLKSSGLERPQWLGMGDIGRQMASFLISMRKASKGITDHYSFSCFSIKEYIYTLFREMKVYHPKVREQYLPMRTFLEKGFMDAHDHLDFAFCHGDFHPLNVIWHNHQINAVIDWEFIGIKPDCYDAANLVGCAGIEHPQGLAMPMVTSFLSNLQKTSVISAAGWRWFPEYVLALRFAWLSEWLKKQDEQMLETEAVFMNILIDQMGELRKIWSIKR